VGEAKQRYEVPESGVLVEAVPLMGQSEPVAGVVSLDTVYAVKIHTAIEESREFLARYREAHPVRPHDPDELQARMMHRSGCPTEEHYARVFRAEGMPAEEAVVEARRMVEADRELLVRYPAP
jgi:hypothetical protein